MAQKKLTRWAEVVEKRQGRPMNYVIMGRDDYLYRKSVRDKFFCVSFWKWSLLKYMIRIR